MQCGTGQYHVRYVNHDSCDFRLNIED